VIVAGTRDVARSRVVQQGSEADIVVHSEIAIEMLERARVGLTFVLLDALGMLIMCRFIMALDYPRHTKIG